MLLIMIYMLSPLTSLQGSDLREQCAAPFKHETCNIAGFNWVTYRKNVFCLCAEDIQFTDR